MPQPNFVPFRPTTSRMTQSRGISAGTSTLCDFPLIDSLYIDPRELYRPNGLKRLDGLERREGLTRPSRLLSTSCSSRAACSTRRSDRGNPPALRPNPIAPANPDSAAPACAG